MEYIILVIGFIVLVKCADIFVEGSSNVAKVLGVPTLIVGLTIVAFGTSAPEASVSIISAIEGKNEISIGNVVGSNICNLLLVLGISSLFKPLKANKQILKKDFLFSIIAYLTLYLSICKGFILGNNKGLLERAEGIILLSFLFLYLYNMITTTSKKQEKEKRQFKFSDIFKIIFGLMGIVLGGNVVVDCATKIARNFGVSEQLIALTIVAIGTSLPELVTSIMATKKGENDIAIGNVIGSNIFNIFFILGVSSLIVPLSINYSSYIDIIIMTIVGVIVYLLTLKDKCINRKKGIFMIFLYIVYIFYIIHR